MVLLGIVGNTLVMNDVFILHYINHKLQKQTAKKLTQEFGFVSNRR